VVCFLPVSSNFLWIPKNSISSGTSATPWPMSSHSCMIILFIFLSILIPNFSSSDHKYREVASGKVRILLSFGYPHPSFHLFHSLLLLQPLWIATLPLSRSFLSFLFLPHFSTLRHWKRINLTTKRHWMKLLLPRINYVGTSWT
jgi:hypothetical protein